MTDPLPGKRALVTGGNRGIGLEVVRLLRDLGLHVFLGSRDPVAGARAAADLSGVEPVAIDVSDASSIVAAATTLLPDGVDVVVNNAAIRPRRRLNERDVDEAWQVNALGPWRVARALLGPMRERRWGRIVNVSTELASRSDRPPADIYAVTKMAMNAMTRALAEDLAGSGVLVNACSPGWCRTEMGGEGAPRSATQGAESIVWGVTLPEDGPTGGFFQDGEPLPW
jgi:NAD(P)-dependent dehydrogenase (short-subunit alcohol dehydrogenase family)